MHERFAAIRTAGGTMETFITHPEEHGPFPAVIIYMDVWGMREDLYDIARRIGTVGYYCLVPDFYYRQGRIRFEFRDPQQRTISMTRLNKDNRQRVRSHLHQLSNCMVIEDTGALLDFLTTEAAVKPGGVGTIGYCMGGRHVLCAAGSYPERLIASASLHGTMLISDRDDSPHHLVQHIRGELYGGFAEHDASAPLAMVQELGELLQSCPVRYQYTIHASAGHGYALPDRDIYDKGAATRDWERIFAMFHRQIPPYTA